MMTVSLERISLTAKRGYNEIKQSRFQADVGLRFAVNENAPIM